MGLYNSRKQNKTKYSELCYSSTPVANRQTGDAIKCGLYLTGNNKQAHETTGGVIRKRLSTDLLLGDHRSYVPLSLLSLLVPL